ncbi:MAG: PQQ-binding-like beta-propeller repeat protein [candidate division WOR-3 bacterium]|nr:PQQ-binding-like beta-propeller repeat protein [candidate division WOR-3 bacterium]
MSHKITILFLVIGVSFLFFAGCKKNKPPETPDIPTGPTVIRKNTIAQYTTKAHDPNKDNEIRYIFDWGDGNFDTTRYFPNDSMADTTHAWVDTGKYQVSVRAQDNKSAFSKEWSETLGVTVVLNRAPNKPLTPIGLSSGSPDIKYTFKTNVVDPDNDSVKVKFNWGNGRTPVWTGFHVSGDTIQDTVTYSDTSTFSIRVIAKDAFEDTSEWSDAFQFQVTVANHPPNKPTTPLGPSSGLPNIKYTFKTNVIDPDNDSVAVKFYWGNGRNPTWTSFHASGDTIQDTVTYSDTGTFSIRVVAKDAYGDTSEWSDVVQFQITRPNRAPNKPTTPIGPSLGLPNIQYIFKTIVIDPDTDSVKVRFYWGDGRTPVWSRFFASGDTIQDTVTYSDTGTFSIRVVAKDAFEDTSEWSDAFQFVVVANLPPNRPSIFSKNPMGAINTRQTFKATATDPNGDSIAIHFSFFSPGQWSIFRASGDTIYGDAVWTQPGIKKVWAIAKDREGAQSVSSETLDFEVIAEGYIKAVFHAMGIEDTSEIHSSPAIAVMSGYEKIFIGSEYGYAYIIDAATMRQEQRIRHYFVDPEDEEPWANSPAVDVNDGKWYMANDQGYFYCLSTAGAKLWVYPDIAVESLARWSFTAAAIGDHIYVLNEDEDTLYAFYKTAGPVSVAWYYYRFGVDLVTAPIIDRQNNLYIGDDSGYVHKLSTSNGQLIWRKRLVGPIASCGAIDNDGTIYFGSNVGLNGFLYALNPDSTLKWSSPYEAGDNITSSPVIGTDGYIYFGDDGGRIHSVNPLNGTAKPGWPIQIIAGGATPSLSSTPAFANDGYFYIMTEEQRVFCIGIDGRIRWETPLPSANKAKRIRRKREAMVPSPVIGLDGDIYVAAGQFEYGLYKLQGRSIGTPANTAWPMFRHDRNHSGKAGYIPTR